MHLAYRAPAYHQGFPRYRRRTRDGDFFYDTMTLERVIKNLTQLTLGIPKTKVENLLDVVKREVVARVPT